MQVSLSIPDWIRGYSVWVTDESHEEKFKVTNQIWQLSAMFIPVIKLVIRLVKVTIGYIGLDHSVLAMIVFYVLPDAALIGYKVMLLWMEEKNTCQQLD